MSSEPNHPSALTGGCLCGAVRYTVNFPKGSAWPPNPSNCQCTQCRKWTGSLIFTPIEISPSQLHYTTPPPTIYNSSPGVDRGFCNTCGSSIYWHSEHENPQVIELAIGTLDEKWLIGEKTGNGVERKGGFGRELGIPTGGTVWFQNRIEGVTDLPKAGKRWEEGTGSREM